MPSAVHENRSQMFEADACAATAAAQATDKNITSLATELAANATA
jgi:hypothetical protein